MLFALFGSHRGWARYRCGFGNVVFTSLFDTNDWLLLEGAMELGHVNNLIFILGICLDTFIASTLRRRSRRMRSYGVGLHHADSPGP